MDMKNLKSKPEIIGVFAVFLLSSVVLCAGDIVESKWTASPPIIDGTNEEWLEGALTTEKDVDVDYAFRNDGRNLYVLFIFKNPKFLSSVNITGITLYTSTSGKKDKDWGVKFTKKTVNGEQLIAHLEKQGQTLTEENKKEILAKPRYIIYAATAINKKGEEVFPSSASPDVDLPGFKIGNQQNLMVYEFRIPLCSRELHPAGIGTEPGKDIKVGFEWGGMTKEMKEAMRGRGGAVTTGADMTTETTGSRGNEGPAPGSSGPKKYSFWADVKLAPAQ
jgi:hypothetical protein